MPTRSLLAAGCEMVAGIAALLGACVGGVAGLQAGLIGCLPGGCLGLIIGGMAGYLVLPLALLVIPAVIGASASTTDSGTGILVGLVAGVGLLAAAILIRVPANPSGTARR